MNLLVIRPFIAPWEVDVYNELEKYQIEVYFALTSFPSSGYEKILRRTLRRNKGYNVYFSKLSKVLSSNYILKKLVWFRLAWPDIDISYNLMNIMKDISPFALDTLENYILSSFFATLCKSKSGAIPEVVKSNENGFLVKSGDPVDLAEKIIKLLEDDSLRESLGRKARLIVEDNYSLRSIVPKLRDLLFSLQESDAK